jgi:DNA-binding Xre family transcriptional regulator
MAIRLKVREVAEAKGIPDAAVLSRRCDIATQTAYRLWGDAETGVRLATLERIAKALGVKTKDLYEEDRAALVVV